MQFRRVIDYLEGICILHNDPGIAQNLEITEQKSELTITNLNERLHWDNRDVGTTSKVFVFSCDSDLKD